LLSFEHGGLVFTDELIIKCAADDRVNAAREGDGCLPLTHSSSLHHWQAQTKAQRQAHLCNTSGLPLTPWMHFYKKKSRWLVRSNYGTTNTM